MLIEMWSRSFCALRALAGGDRRPRGGRHGRWGQDPSGWASGCARVPGRGRGSLWRRAVCGVAACVVAAPAWAADDAGAIGVPACSTILADQLPAITGGGLVTSWDVDGPGPRRAVLVLVGTMTGNRVPFIISTQRTGVWTFDGVRWSQIDSGLPGPATAVGTFQNRLVVAGVFDDPSTLVGNAPLSLLAWDGVRWSRLPGRFAPTRGGTITSIQEFNGQLFVAGTFSTVDGRSLMNIARFDGDAWQPAGAGFNLGVNGLGVVATGGGAQSLYAVGNFSTSGATLVNSVARWNGAAWQPVGAGFNRRAWAVAEYQGQLVALHESSGAQTPGWSVVSRFDGQLWSPLGAPVDAGAPPSRSLVVADGTIYQQARVGPSGGFASFDGAAWTTVGIPNVASSEIRMAQVNATPLMLAWTRFYWLSPTAAELFSQANTSRTFVAYVRSVGGRLLTVGAPGRLFGTSAPASVNVYEGFAWRALPGLVGTAVDAVLFDGQTTVVGQFSSIGAGGSGVVAAWNGASWDNLGLQGGQANSAAVVDGTLYVSGVDLLATSPPATGRIVCKIGADWRALPDPGAYWSQPALASFRGRLIVYGGFLGAQGGPNHIAEWGGAGWRALSPTALRSPVLAATIDADSLYVGTNDGVFRLDGTAWTSLGDPPTSPENIAIVNGRLVVGAGRTFYELAGNQWRPLRFEPASFDCSPRSLRAIDGQLWATDINVGANRPVRFNLDASTITFETPDAPANFRPASRAFAVAVSGPTPTSAVWRRNGTPLSPGGTLPGGSTYFGGDTLRLTLNNIRPGEVGVLDCVVTAPCGTLTSRTWRIDAPCISDFNRDGIVALNDVFAFIGAYFANSASANINGVGGITPQDVFDFLNAFLAGC